MIASTHRTGPANGAWLRTMLDVLFVALTLASFAGLGALVSGLERP